MSCYTLLGSRVIEGNMQRLGVLLVNLGSPDEPRVPSVRRYLDEFLGDHMVIDAPRLLWWLVRKLVILPRRPKVTAHAYGRIWMPEGSPLVVHSRRQAAGLGKALGSDVRVAVGMRYGSPSLDDAVASLAGCDQVVFLPMFPQMSRTTLGTALAAARRALARAELPVIEVAPYYDHPAYIEALAERFRDALASGPVDHVLLSFHGLPTRLVEEEGDPYRDHCEATAAALAEAVGLGPDDWTLTYQSRFGREPWLEPATADVVAACGSMNERLLVACPGFPADCLETLEEIDMTARDAFMATGGREFRYVPCLNDSPAWIEAMATLVHESVARAGRLTSS